MRWGRLSWASELERTIDGRVVACARRAREAQAFPWINPPHPPCAADGPEGFAMAAPVGADVPAHRGGHPVRQCDHGLKRALPAQALLSCGPPQRGPGQLLLKRIRTVDRQATADQTSSCRIETDTNRRSRAIQATGQRTRPARHRLLIEAVPGRRNEGRRTRTGFQGAGPPMTVPAPSSRPSITDQSGLALRRRVVFNNWEAHHDQRLAAERASSYMRAHLQLPTAGC